MCRSKNRAVWFMAAEEKKLKRNVCDDKHRFHGSFQQDMRLSFRKAVKLAAVLSVLLLVNVFIGFKLSVVSYTKPGKLLGHFKHDNGEPLESSSKLHASAGPDGQSRQQRSAKSFPRASFIDKLGPEVADIQTHSSGAQKKKLSTELTHSQPVQPTEISDIFISVKTSGKFHASRLQLVLQTWYLLAKDQVSLSSSLSLSPPLSLSNNSLIIIKVLLPHILFLFLSYISLKFVSFASAPGAGCCINHMGQCFHFVFCLSGM